MIASLFLLFVAAGIVFGVIVVGFGNLAAILLAVIGLGLLVTCLAFLIMKRCTTS